MHRDLRTVKAAAVAAGLMAGFALALQAGPAPAPRLLLSGAHSPAPVPQARLASPLPRLSPKPLAGGLSIAELFDLLKVQAPQPVVESVAKAFKAEPALERELGEVLDTLGPEAPASELVRRLSRLPEFRGLVAKFSSDPSSRSAFAAAMKDPRLRPLGREIRAARVALASRRRERERTAAARPLSTSPSASGATSSTRPSPRWGGRSEEALSLFAATPQWVRERLEGYCVESGCPDPVEACRAVGAFQECMEALEAARGPGSAATASSSLSRRGASAGAPEERRTSEPAPQGGPEVAASEEPKRQAAAGPTPETPGSFETAGRKLGETVGSAIGNLLEAITGDPRAGDAVEKEYGDLGAQIGKRIGDTLEALIVGVTQVVLGFIDEVAKAVTGLLEGLLRKI